MWGVQLTMKGEIQGHADFEGLNLVKEPRYAISAYATIKHK